MKRGDSIRDIVDLNGPRAPVEIDVTFSMALPPWENGAFVEETADMTVGLLALGRPRYEQLCYVSGTVRRLAVPTTISLAPACEPIVSANRT